MKKGKITKKKLGGWGWDLPKKAESGEPAKLPEEVVRFNEKLANKRGVSESTKSSESLSETSSGKDDDDDDDKPTYHIEPRLIFNGTT